MVSTAQVASVSQGRFETLDALRGICALLVALFHFRASGAITSLAIVQNGWLFVDYFFVLSGFVIAHGYGVRLQSGEVSPGRFLALRFARLYPLHLAVLLAFVAIEGVLWLFADQLSGITTRTAFSDSRDGASLLQNLFLLQSLGLRDGLSWNGPSWSISAEMWTYVLFSVVLMARGRALAILAALLAALALILMVRTSGSLDWTYDWGAVRAILGFATGVLTYLAFRRFGVLSGTVWEAAALVGAGLFVALAEGTATFAAPPVFALTIWLLAGEKGVVARILKMRCFQLLGLLSYSIYMVHTFVQARLGEVLQLSGLSGVSADDQGITHIDAAPLVGDGLSVAMLALVIGASMISYHLVEEPGRRLLKRWLA